MDAKVAECKERMHKAVLHLQEARDRGGERDRHREDRHRVRENAAQLPPEEAREDRAHEGRERRDAGKGHQVHVLVVTP